MPLTTQFLTLETNTAGRDFAVGDLHGHVSQLHEQLADIGFDPSKDRLICVGDLIDRGPESADALKLLDEPWFYCVIGNHEELMLQSLRYHDSRMRMLWLNNGGDWIMNTDSSLWPGWLDAIESLPLGIEVTSASGTRYGITHADFPLLDWGEFATMSGDQLSQVIWARDNFRQRSEHKVRGVDWLVHGHNVTDNGESVQLGNRIYIEAGAYQGNRLILYPLL